MAGAGNVTRLRIREKPPVAPAYAELHVTTNFTFLEGGSHPQELVAQAKALGLAAIAVTDRNTLAGVVRAHVAAKEAGLRLVVGARLDFADGTPSLLCLPTDRAAYGRLSRLLSRGQMRAEKGECHLHLEDLAELQTGQILIVLPPDDWDWRGHAASRQSPFARQLERLRSRITAALYLAISCLYRGNDRARLAAIESIALAHGLPPVATDDVLYHAPDRRPLQDVLTCIREGVASTRPACASRPMPSGT